MLLFIPTPIETAERLNVLRVLSLCTTIVQQQHTFVFQSDIIAERNASSQVQWDSLLVGAYPDKLALLQGVVDPEYMKAFKIKEAVTALSDAILLATISIDLATYHAGFIKSSL